MKEYVTALTGIKLSLTESAIVEGQTKHESGKV